ncbi:alpha/beta fold hydrolase [Porticoccus sp. W117]|uniref:alpha/beta hydrolase n=1 Tax=Porticoccus sp. W117 TaxID=3054777 RepID=UPI00259AE6A9|nr:alpha/beta fold hydrolase [Porticoccus sp. W117]MDM3870561.1 alpha/beta fold hydrolase [Porticoccus sp. W117]
MNWLIKLCCIAATVYLAIGGLLYLGQRHLLYHPTPPQHLPDNIEVLPLAIENGSEKLLRLNPGHNRALLYLGGNAEQVANSAPQLAEQLPNHTIYLLNYRGYGGSDGKHSEQNLYRDATSSYELIARQHSHIAVMGRSLGTGIATYLASRENVERLVLITPYDSITAVAQRHYPLFPLQLLIKDRYDSLSRANAIDTPTLIMIAEQDRVIPPIHARRLADALPPENTSVEIIPGSDHNSVAQHPRYWSLIGDFLQH